MSIIKINKVIQCFNFFMMFVLCVVFTSCRTVRQLADRSVKIDVRHDNIEVSIPIEGIPIMAWDGVQVQTIERYLELKEAGINYNFTFYPNVDVVAQAMDAAKTAGVRIMIYCPELMNEPEKVVNRFKDHPALAGYHLTDEPHPSQFKSWGEFARRIKAADNEHFCYINLLPGTSRADVQSFLSNVPVSFLSFDYYPIIVNDSGIRSMNEEWWYRDLEIISSEARMAGIPFWAFALTTAHRSYPIPTLADLRLQVYSNLAYGAQGIQYFTYWTPPFYQQSMGYNNGPIDNNTGQKTATWYTVQQMNKEIKALSSVFLGAQVIKVEHIGTSIPTGTTRFNFAKRPKEANIIKTFTIPNNTNALVSFLKNGNRCYMVIVNRNLEGGDNVTFTIKGGTGLQLIQKDGTAVPASKAGSNQTVTPGDALIYGWDI